MRLTQSFVNNLKPTDIRKDIYDDFIRGLFVRVQPTGRKTWFLKFGDHNNRTYKIGDATILSPSQAREKAQEFLSMYIVTGSDPRGTKSESLTLKTLLSEYKKAGGSAYIHNTVIQAFAKELEMQIIDLTLLWLERWRTQYIQSCDRKKATANRKTVALNTLLNWALSRKIIDKNPISGIKRLKETDSETKIRYLTDDERKRLFEALAAREQEVRLARARTLARRSYLPSLENTAFVDYLKPLVITALNTGIRQNALFSLKWNDINFTEKTITLLAAHAKSKQQSILPMNETVYNTLSAWKNHISSSEYVFPSPHTNGKLNNCKKAWAALLKNAEIDNFRFHDMRHDFASQLVMKGVDLNTVRELMTHSDIKMTLRYAHLAPTKAKNAVDLLD